MKLTSKLNSPSLYKLYFHILLQLSTANKFMFIQLDLLQKPLVHHTLHNRAEFYFEEPVHISYIHISFSRKGIPL